MKKKLFKLTSATCVIAFLATFYGAAIVNTPKTSAIKATEFKAGRIIDDEVFYNVDTMTVAQIQEVLEKNVPNCDTQGTGKVGSRTYPDGTKTTASTTRAEYAAEMKRQGKTNYHEPPYVCLDNYYENPKTHKNLYDTKGLVEEGMISAAQIIYNAAHEHGINPQVLIVMLKKESYVWSDNWPLRNEYNAVMGYACPDNAPCDEQYYGFQNQVNRAAWQLRYYKEHIRSYNYTPGAENSIFYSPDYSCGRKQVYIENYATASLYIYTPYTPNDAALAAYPGTAACGSYGNRNFFMFFNEMFGSTWAAKQTPATPEVTPKDPATNNTGTQQPSSQQPSTQQPSAQQPVEEKPVVKLTPMEQAFADLGDYTKKFGKLISKDVESNEETGCRWKQYENAYFVGTDKTGYFESSGKIREVWAAQGFESGSLGLPISKVETNAKTGIWFQQYQGGYIVGTDKTGYFISSGKIREVWKNQGFESGSLGLPISGIETNAKTGIWFQQYQGGFIVGTDKTGYFISSGKIREVWKNQGFESGSLGLPISGIETNAKTGIWFQQYQGGFIVGTDKTGYWISDGKIRSVWAAQGFESGTLGFPIGKTETNPKSGIWFQQYQGGYIVGSDKTGYFISSGKIREYWARNNFEFGILGFPTGNVYHKDGCEYQAYQRFTVKYDPRGNTYSRI